MSSDGDATCIYYISIIPSGIVITIVTVHSIDYDIRHYGILLMLITALYNCDDEHWHLGRLNTAIADFDVVVDCRILPLFWCYNATLLDLLVGRCWVWVIVCCCCCSVYCHCYCWYLIITLLFDIPRYHWTFGLYFLLPCYYCCSLLLQTFWCWLLFWTLVQPFPLVVSAAWCHWWYLIVCSVIAHWPVIVLLFHCSPSHCDDTPYPTPHNIVRWLPWLNWHYCDDYVGGIYQWVIQFIDLGKFTLPIVVCWPGTWLCRAGAIYWTQLLVTRCSLPTITACYRWPILLGRWLIVVATVPHLTLLLLLLLLPFSICYVWFTICYLPYCYWWLLLIVVVGNC